MEKKVAVVGSGIIGLSTALAIKLSNPELQVTILSCQKSPFTTGDGSAGFWMPYLLGKEVSSERLQQWCDQTFEFLLNLYKSPKASQVGIGLFSAYWLFNEPQEDFPFAKTFINYRRISEREADRFGVDTNHGIFVTTLFTECKKLLPYLEKQFTDLGGKLVVRRIHSFQELSGEYNLIINCTGIGASKLVTDPKLKPIRGQVTRVQAPWIKHGLIFGDYYILLNTDVITLGGTKQVDNWNTSVDEKDTIAIEDGCKNLIKSLKTSTKLGEWVGLRPGRDVPRIEREKTSEGCDIIHNYGHGGSGVTIFWGCAQEVVQLVKSWLLDQQNQPKLKSNL